MSELSQRLRDAAGQLVGGEPMPYAALMLVAADRVEAAEQTAMQAHAQIAGLVAELEAARTPVVQPPAPPVVPDTAVPDVITGEPV